MRHSAFSTLSSLFVVLMNCAASAVSASTNTIARVNPETFLISRETLGAITFTGTVREIVDDDLDICYHFIVLDVDHTTIYCPIRNAPKKALTALVGAQVSITGIRDLYNLPSGRRLLGNRLYVKSLNDITVLTPSPKNPFDVKRAEEMRFFPAVSTHFLGKVKMVGKVLAAWDQTHFLLHRDDGLLAKIETIDAAPPANAWVETVGNAESDLFNVNLLQAIWRPADGGGAISDPVTNTSARAILENAQGQREISHEFYGRVIRLRGIVRNVQEEDGRVTVINIENDGRLIAVRVSNAGGDLPDVPPGCVIDATGVCVFDIDNWYPNAPFPYVKGFFVVPRTADDIVVVRRPPWWTAERLLAVIGGLVGLLVAIAVWNRVLRHMVERRGRELFKEQVSRVSANLRTEERTRLAIELHDSISQNLTGVALQLKAAQTTAGDDLATALRHLDIAERSLASCHAELRNCLWDLRHGALESLDMNEAIRQVVRPQVGDVALEVRFNVPRRRLTDNTAYSILKIIRELAVNAVHHGRATSVRVAGALEPDRILFSVTDNGCGFDPKAAPGPEQGHFGLLGVTERINSFEGSMTVDSTPGKGTRVVVALRSPQTKENTI